jgi:hypothetical protein
MKWRVLVITGEGKVTRVSKGRVTCGEGRIIQVSYR